MTLAAMLLLSLFAALPCAHAMPQADEAEIQRFTLTQSFLDRYAATVADAHAHHDADENTDPKELSASMVSLDAFMAYLDRQPHAAEYLRAHDLPLREAAVGSLVLLRAAVADGMLSNPQTAKYVDASKLPSPANMAFYRAHKAQIQSLLSMDSAE